VEAPLDLHDFGRSGVVGIDEGADEPPR
jgi:hypothetical protein